MKILTCFYPLIQNQGTLYNAATTKIQKEAKGDNVKGVKVSLGETLLLKSKSSSIKTSFVWFVNIQLLVI